VTNLAARPAGTLALKDLLQPVPTFALIAMNPESRES